MSAISTIALLSGAGVLGFAGFLLLQGVMALVRPARVRAFLGHFAGSARAHFTEMFLRVVVGLAFLCFAPFSARPMLFEAFGMVLLVTTVLLLFVPWRVHRRFASWAVPLATRHMAPYALGSLALGMAVVHAVIAGHVPV